jgi:hypothetical protein
MIYPHYWPSIDHASRWTQVGVSVIPCNKWMFGVSLLSVGRIICQKTQRPALLDTTPPVPVPASFSAKTSLMKVANWDGTSEGIIQAVATSFKADDYLACAENLKARGIDPQSYINNLDKVSPISGPKVARSVHNEMTVDHQRPFD